MFTISAADFLTFFYPTGNTPAVSLTQGLPPKTPANVLLLGCGDVRHILFSLHADRESIPPLYSDITRPLDITACDLQPAIIGTFLLDLVYYPPYLKRTVARNIFLLTLIIDDAQNKNDKLHWDLYFHFRIDATSLSRLKGHAQKLRLLSATLQDWEASEYGKIIKFCDQVSLQQSREIWDFYENCNQSSLEVTLGKGLKIQSEQASGANQTATTSSSPVFIATLDRVSEIRNHYWKHGTMDTDLNIVSSARHLNPLFAGPSKEPVLHHGSGPLLGFQLPAVSAPLTADSDLFQNSTDPEKIVNAARAEFAAWTSSFRRSNSKESVSIRFFAGDAVALCLQLQNSRAGLLGQNPSAAWYRDRTHFQPIVLGKDYAAAVEESAPTIFDVIDTSNLVDHIGSLNILIAVAPLLKVDISAILYTETMRESSTTRKDVLNSLFGAHFPTLSTLLGLVLVEIVTNASDVSAGEEALLVSKVKLGLSQQVTRIAWKRPTKCQPPLSEAAVHRVAFDAIGLAHVLYSVYLHMFQGEDMDRIIKDISIGKKTVMQIYNLTLLDYNRASFATFLRFIKSRVITDWNAAIKNLLSRIESNRNCVYPECCLHELHVWLHLLNVYTVDALLASPGKPVSSETPRDLRCWEDIPPVVCVNIKIPRKQLPVFINQEEKLGMIPLYCAVRSPSGRYHHQFAALQTGFGTLSSRGTRFSCSFELDIADDVSGWLGQSPLLASFYMPAATLLLLEPQKTTFVFGFKTTLYAAKPLSNLMGSEMVLLKTTLDDTEHVYVTENLPNLQSRPVVVPTVELNDELQIKPNTDIKANPTIAVISDAGTIKSFSSRVDLQGNPKEILGQGCEISTTAVSPFSFRVQLKQGPSIIMDFPIPVAPSNIKTRIARKSSYIELVATVEAAHPAMSTFTFPLLQTSSGPMLWNLPYIDLNLQPTVDTTTSQFLYLLKWMATDMLSQQHSCLGPNSSTSVSAEEQTTIRFKTSLLYLLTYCKGLQGDRVAAFRFSCPSAGGFKMLLFASSVRLDLSNRTVIVDAAVVPFFEELTSKIHSFLSKLTADGKLCQFTDVRIELNHPWKQMLPAWAERCRSWSHKTSCEYAFEGDIPLSTEQGKRFLCSCGKGQFPAGYLSKLPNWNELSPYAVRVAISPLFHSALVNDVCNPML